jgi:hypothetical protein
MKAKEYVIFSEAVEAGINIGWNRAFKHNNLTEEQQKTINQLEHTIKDYVYQEVTGQVCEYFKFEDNEEA